MRFQHPYCTYLLCLLNSMMLCDRCKIKLGICNFAMEYMMGLRCVKPVLHDRNFRMTCFGFIKKLV